MIKVGKHVSGGLPPASARRLNVIRHNGWDEQQRLHRKEHSQLQAYRREEGDPRHKIKEQALLPKEKTEKSDGTAAETRQNACTCSTSRFPFSPLSLPLFLHDYLVENAKVIKYNIEWTMFKDIRAFTKCWVQVMKYSKALTQDCGGQPRSFSTTCE